MQNKSTRKILILASAKINPAKINLAKVDMIFWNIELFEKSLDSTQVKRWLISSKNIFYNLPNKVPKDLRFSILRT